MRVSYSQLDTFSVCPAKYKFQYLEKIKTPKSKEALFGTLIHECLRLFHSPDSSIPLSEEDLLKYFTAKWENEPYQDKQEEAFAFHQGIEILKNYYAQNQTINSTVVGLEVPFKTPLKTSDKEQFHISGRIDRIDKLLDGSFEVIDYKTSRKMPPQSEVDSNLQLSVYYLGLLNRWPKLAEEKRPIKLSLYYVRHGEKISTIQKKEQLEENKEKIKELVEEIKNSHYQPRANPLCDWCPYQPHCPLYKHKYLDSYNVDDCQIKEAIKRYFVIKDQQASHAREMAQLKETINRYCDEKGIDRVFGDEGYITRLSQQRFSYDPEKIKEVLKPLNKWEAVLSLDKTKLKKIIPSLPRPERKELEKAKIQAKEFKTISAKKTPLNDNSSKS